MNRHIGGMKRHALGTNRHARGRTGELFAARQEPIGRLTVAPSHSARPLSPTGSLSHHQQPAPTSTFLPTPVQHVCRPPSTPMLNRFFLLSISFFSSPLLILCMGYPSRHSPQSDRSPPICPGFSTPDSGSRLQAAPWSPRWLIGLPSAPKPSPAKDFSSPGSPRSAQNVVPVAVTAGDKIEGLRQWASGRCLSADRGSVYSRAEVGVGRGRRVMREPGVN